MTDDDTTRRANDVRQRIAAMKQETERLRQQTEATQARILMVCEAVFDLSIPLPAVQDAVRADLSDDEQAEVLRDLVEGATR